MKRNGTYGPTALRLVAGSLMAGHGLQKLTKRLGGHGLDGTTAGFQAMGLHPARTNATLAGAAEVAGGVGWMLGAATPVASAMTTGTMSVAIAKVHGKNGVWITKGGAEYNLILIAIAFALAAGGPGRLAVDGWLTRSRSGLGWAVAQLGVGAAGAAAVIANARRLAPAPTPDTESTATAAS